MTLLEVRRYAIRNRVRVRFSLPEAGECLVNEHGLLKLPALRAAPNFKLEVALGEVRQFLVEPVERGGKPRRMAREELASLLQPSTKQELSHEE